MAKSNGRRKKNAAERQRDVKDWEQAKDELFHAVHDFYDRFADYEGDYGSIGVAHYDKMKGKCQEACFVRNRLDKDYVADNLAGQWETTTHTDFYKPGGIAGNF